MKYIIFLSAAILMATTAMAQRNAETQTQYRTDVSVKAQLMGTSQSGLQYRSPAVKPAAAASGDGVQQSRGLQIRNNAAPGQNYKKTESRSAAVVPATSGHNLPSDKKAEPAPPQPVAEMPKSLTQ